MELQTTDLLSASDRLDRLHSQVNALNEALREALEAESSGTPRRMAQRGRPRPASERLRFRRRALKLAIFAPY